MAVKSESSAASSPLNAEQQQRYRSRVSELGLDPDFHDGPWPVMLPVRGIDNLRRVAGLADMKHEQSSPLTAEKIEGLTNMMARQAVSNHVFGVRGLADSKTSAALEQRFPVFPVLAYTAADIVITAANPLIINRNSAVTVFGKVTLKDGGYIVISVDAHFACEVLEKIPGGQSPMPNDITVQGLDGAPGDSGNSPGKAKNGDNGGNAECDCCGGAVAHGASNGQNGADGSDGGNGFNGVDGMNGPNVRISIGSLKGNLTVLQRGGNGGPGGEGGRGGEGGDGGKGGSGTTCGAFQPDGGRGGNGGVGGNGGAGSNGGNAGNGGYLTVVYTPADANSGVIGNNSLGRGGLRGSPGIGGKGGQGGAAGARGGTAGEAGKNGIAGSDIGQNGRDGVPGQFLINGQAI